LKRWHWVILILVCLGGVVAAGIYRQQSDKQAIEVNDLALSDQVDRKEEPSAVKVEAPSLSKALGLTKDDMVVVGGVKRPKRDVGESKGYDSRAIRAEYLASLPDIGVAPSIDKDASPAAAKLLEEAAEEGSEKRYLSTSSKTAPFDRESYLTSPEEYLVKTRPGRIRQTAKPGEDVAPLKAQGAQFAEILQGESVFLTALAEPGMPVTFHTQQLGEFDNRLKTISVAADEKGIAKVKYHAVSGVVGSVFVVAASPVHSGRSPV